MNTDALVTASQNVRSAARHSLIWFWLLLSVVAAFSLAAGSVRSHTTRAALVPDSPRDLPTCHPAASDDGENVEIVAHAGSGVWTLDIQDGYLYAGKESTLHVFPVAQRPELRPVGTYIIGGKHFGHLSFSIYRVRVSGSYVYALDYFGYVHIIDVSNPSHPYARGTCGLESYQQPRDMIVKSPYLFLALPDAGLYVLDVSDPDRPAIAAALLQDVGAVNLAMSQNHLYAVDRNNVLHSIDIANPAAPRLLDAFTLGASVRTMATSGEHLYVFEEDPNVRILHTVDPALLHETETLAVNFKAVQARIDPDKHLLYVSAGADGTYVFDVSTPWKLTQVATVPPVGVTNEIGLDRGVLFAAEGMSGIRAVDITDLDNPVEVGRYRTGSTSGWDVEVADGYAYIVASESGLTIVDVTEPAHPQYITTLNPLNHEYGDIRVQNQRVYCKSNAKGFDIFDVSEPHTPQLIGSFIPAEDIGDFDVHGDLLFFDTGKVLHIYDMSDLAHPKSVGAFQSPFAIGSVAVGDDYAALWDNNDTIAVVDVSDPPNPKLLGSVDNTFLGGAGPIEMVVDGGYAYIASGFAGYLQIIDMTDPFHPKIVARLGRGNFAADVSAQGGWAAVTDWDAGISFYDVTRPADSTVGAHFNMPGTSLGVAVDNGLIYGVSLGGGLAIMRYADPRTPTPTPFPTASPTPTATPTPTPAPPGGAGQTGLASTVVLTRGGSLQASLAGLTITVAFPPGSTDRPLHVAMRTSQAPVLGDLLALGEPFALAGKDEFGTPVSSMQAPFTVTVDYTAAPVPPGEKSLLALHVWSADAGKWNRLPTQVHPTLPILHARWSRLDDFAVLVGKPEPIYLPVVGR